MAQTVKKQGFSGFIKEILQLLLIVFIVRTVGFGLYQVPTGSMETTMLVGERFFADKLTYWFSKPQQNQIIAFNDPLYPYSKNIFMRFFEHYVWGPSNWTKRVIGVPGDHIKGVIEEGHPVVYRNGVRMNETYINKLPLLYVWKIDQAERNKLLRSGVSGELLGELISPKSYDPSKPYDNQPYYDINPARILHEIPMQIPGTPLHPEKNITSLPDDRNYWTGSDIFNVHLGANEYWVMGDNRLGSKDSRFFGPIDSKLIHGRILWRIWSMDSDESWWIIDLIKHPIDFWKKIRWSRFFQSVN